MSQSTLEIVSKMSIVDEPVDEIKEKIRYMSIDVFRGLAIAAMIFVNTISPFENTLAWSKHAIDFGDAHGGFIGGFGYGVMMLLSTAIVDDFRELKKLLFLIYGIIFTVFGVSLHFIWVGYGFPSYGGLSKLRVSHSYILLTIGLAAFCFWVIWFLYDHFNVTKNKSYFLEPQGKNAFFLFLLQPIFLGLATLILKSDSHVALVFFIGFLNVAIIWATAFLMDKYKVYITI